MVGESLCRMKKQAPFGGMPRVVAEAGLADQVLPIHEIVEALNRAMSKSRSHTRQ